MARGRKAAAVPEGPIEGLWELPDGWWWERLGSLGTWVGGGTPSKANAAFWTDGEIPWVSPKDMKASYIEDAEDYITHAALEASSAKLVPSGSVVLVMRSGILSHSLPVAVTRREVTLNQDLRALSPRDDVRADFVAHYLRAAAQAILHKCSKDGTTVSSIETERLMKWPVPMTALDGQDHVVQSVGRLFDELDEGEVALAQARNAVGVYRRALLKAAVVGALTADWRALNPVDEDAHSFLESLRAGGVAGRLRGRPIEPVSFAQDHEDLPELPEGWTWAAVSQLGEVITGATPPTSRDELYGGDIPFFTPSDLDAGFGLTRARRTITYEGLSTVRPIDANAVMVTCIGATIGKTGHTSVAGATNQQINSVNPFAEELAPYLFAYFSGTIGKTRIIEQSSSTTLPILNKGDFSRLPVPLPPRAELREINARLQAALRDHSDQQAVLDDVTSALLQLRQTILAAAFRGDLITEFQA